MLIYQYITPRAAIRRPYPRHTFGEPERLLTSVSLITLSAKD
jgi:hypothetical protein